MSQRNRITGQTAPNPGPDMNEALHRVVTPSTVRPRRLIAAGMKRGNGRLTIQAIAS